jgi:hypothetical protein
MDGGGEGGKHSITIARCAVTKQLLNSNKVEVDYIDHGTVLFPF